MKQLIAVFESKKKSPDRAVPLRKNFLRNGIEMSRTKTLLLFKIASQGILIIATEYQGFRLASRCLFLYYNCGPINRKKSKIELYTNKNA